jgi:hypothetical protein
MRSLNKSVEADCCTILIRGGARGGDTVVDRFKSRLISADAIPAEGKVVPVAIGNVEVFDAVML